MNQLPDTIPKEPALKPAEDYYRLRREGIGFIEKLGSHRWTDYNTHDPGITILEALCYALTDLAYHSGWNIKDILAVPSPQVYPEPPYPIQPFFTARDILTTNPWTPDDFRRLLIDLDTVRNAWVFCKECACDLYYYAWCEEDQLKLSYQKSPKPQVQSQKVEPLGLYDILLELETDPELGDLNDRKIEHTYAEFDKDGRPHLVIMELRFPEWGLAKWDEYKLFLDSTDAFTLKDPLKFNRRKIDDTAMTDVELRKHWRDVFYIDFKITLSPSGKTIIIENAALRVYGDTFAKGKTTVERLATILTDKTPLGFIQRYRNKLLKVKQAVKEAKTGLHDHRNLCEDYCHVKGVNVEDVAVCADVEVALGADIERVQAEIWFEIEEYFNPAVSFYTLQELMDTEIPVEEIFNGPALKHGFIKGKELDVAGLKTVLRTSDIVNQLMKINGVIAVNNLQLTKYDSEGNFIKGSADPVFDNEGKPIFDAKKASASWLLFVSELHQPRLYHNQSRFLFYKNGLPFLPRMDEVYDTLTQLRGEAERPKIKSTPNDLPIPKGNFRNPENYFPVQYSFPLTYGIGPDGLPSHASNLRRAQAMQLKAYLMVYEQLLGNAFAQLAHTADLFSLDPKVKCTYFVHEFSDDIIKGYFDIINGLDKDKLENLAETLPEFRKRRNRFLDHIMARFGEQFSDYAILLTNFEGRQVALDQLIDDKISFLKTYPSISKNRGKATNYTKPPALPGNEPGLKKRVSLLLGYPNLTFSWTTQKEADVFKVTHFELQDQNKVIWMTGELTLDITDKDENKAIQKAYEIIISQMSDPDALQIKLDKSPFHLLLQDKDDNPLGQRPKTFDIKTEAQHFKDELLRWSANERAIVVEHLLLRPKFPGDAFYPACTEGACKTCGDEDPYSFRLTFIMPGWTAPFNTNLDARGFAERTIRQETPSHLLVKICWVGNDEFFDDPDNPVVTELVELLETQGRTIDGERVHTETELCDCATNIYIAFNDVFKDWYEDKIFDYFHSAGLKRELEEEFNNKVKSTEISCAIVLDRLWNEIIEAMINHFNSVALYGRQFERFEKAWRQWLEANALCDWTEQRLQERVEAILEGHMNTGAGKQPPSKEELCRSAAAILLQYGQAFHDWMGKNINENKALKDFKDLNGFSPPPITLNNAFDTDAKEQISNMLKARYTQYVEVSYRLWMVVNLLSNLSNIHSVATLHDCDEGNDKNPVRLGKTALGNFKRC